MLEVSILIIAIAFSALVIYLIFMLKEASTVLRQIASTLVFTRQKVDELSQESRRLLGSINKKSENLDSVFETLNVLGEISLDKAKEYQHREEADFDAYNGEEARSEGRTVSDWISWLSSGVCLWKHFKRK